MPGSSRPDRTDQLRRIDKGESIRANRQRRIDGNGSTGMPVLLQLQSFTGVGGGGSAQAQIFEHVRLSSPGFKFGDNGVIDFEYLGE